MMRSTFRRPPIADAELDPHSRRLRMSAMDQTITVRRSATPATPTTARSPTSTIGSVSSWRRYDHRAADDTIVIFIADHGDMLGERASGTR